MKNIEGWETYWGVDYLRRRGQKITPAVIKGVRSYVLSLFYIPIGFSPDDMQSIGVSPNGWHLVGEEHSLSRDFQTLEEALEEADKWE